MIVFTVLLLWGAALLGRVSSRQASKGMAGLVKAKKYDWKDSNLALFGSDQERKVAIRSIGLL